ncbi:uncharacterized protein LOC112486511 [Cynoglossus semilaevis]|uniref:uncharacterized protein LOC112486511 n=1 Tax=Cynoglossus semilaevis TaxID=244447 RepID=UPI000D63010F|nr:uncharacterized protein LOC112486511 [Cynoglossus semilaevis]
MVDNPDMAGCESTVWERHLIHHLSRAQETVDEEQDSLKELQAQLLKLQLTEAKQKISNKKKQDKTNPKNMVATQPSPQNDLGDAGLHPWVPPPPMPPQRPSYQRFTGGYGRGRGVWGGGRGRGGPPRGPQGRDQCYFCNQTGHWVRNYPQRQGSFQRGGRGRGGPRPCGTNGWPCPIEGQCTTHPVKRQLPLTEWDQWENWGDQQQQ